MVEEGEVVVVTASFLASGRIGLLVPVGCQEGSGREVGRSRLRRWWGGGASGPRAFGLRQSFELLSLAVPTGVSTFVLVRRAISRMRRARAVRLSRLSAQAAGAHFAKAFGLEHVRQVGQT